MERGKPGKNGENKKGKKKGLGVSLAEKKIERRKEERNEAKEAEAGEGVSAGRGIRRKDGEEWRA